MTTTIDLTGRVTLVTGASRGIGAAIARTFAAAGSHLVLAARNHADLQALATDLNRFEVETLVVATDVTDPAAVQALVAATMDRYGQLDCAVNNAGGGFTGKTALADLTLEQFRAGIDLNLTSVFLCLKQEIPAMLASGGGTIVNISSRSGLSAAPGMGAYVVGKHGLQGLTKLAALDYADKGVRVNALAPGPILAGPLAEMPEEFRQGAIRSVPMHTLGEPDDVAQAALWLCSDAARYITGATLPIDGGQLAG
jgi:NAD(P)-dependent dehydrogenase (short-subunit alcohol dehydrogenase family)